MEELKVCCGKKVFIQKVVLSHIIKLNYWMIWCKVCNFAAKEVTKKQAIAAWNRREVKNETE